METLTWPEMNSMLVEMLREDKNTLLGMYAAQRIEELEFELTQTKFENGHLTGLIRDNEEAAPALARGYDDLAAQYDKLAEDYDKLIKAKDYAEGELESHERILQGKEEELKKYISAFQLEREENNRLTKKILTLKNKFNSLVKQEKEHLNELVLRTDNRNTELENKLEVEKERVASLKYDYARAVHENEQAAQALEQLKDEYDETIHILKSLKR